VIRALFLVVLFFSAATSSFTADSARETTLVPQIVYVGDRARLIVPLDSVLSASAPLSLVIDQRESLPKTGSVLIHRIEIERRPLVSRAIIDFTAFAPGDVAFPTIELGGLRLAGLRVKITSVLENGATELSPPEAALTAPGTYLFIYGAIVIVLIAVSGTLFLVLRGIPRLTAYLERRRRGLAAGSLRRVLARLQTEGGQMEEGVFLTILFDELRSYLTYRTGSNCHALTAREFSLVLGSESIVPHFSSEDLAFLESLFRRGDAVRFGAVPISSDELRSALHGVGELVDHAEAAAC